MKSPFSWLIDDWKRERFALYWAIGLFVTAEMVQAFVLISVYMRFML